MATIDAFHHGVAPENDFGYAQAIRSGELIHVSGQVAFDEAGEFAHADDCAAQLTLTYANLDKVLEHYGATRNQIVSQTVYGVRLQQNAEAISAGNLAYYGAHRPVSTVVGVTELAFPGQLVEIAVVVDARLPA
ncbi:Rid family hydrolase [Streptomyces sp. NBC_01808]|uniref:Rid family hydrolase n=1 Tax=Streptomyces sp. NBC_01808 TaxID=2975947 RepID=UPI002DD7ED38|nr:Rid family hydrolase [Streptomyces sp. NBC_01808]WSA36132.1 Rid family hydrolase [Streptomyces sp. NBC_01808]